MAKKVRTPPPPRRVQAPQRRSSKKREDRRAAINRDYLTMRWVLAGAAVAIAAIVAVLFLVLRDESPGSKNATAANYNSLPGVRRTKAPWPPEYASLADRLAPLGLNALSEEGQVVHIHAHLDIFVNGKAVPGDVPAGIGFSDASSTPSYITELHTHDVSGIIHVESPTEREFTLGQFLGEWGVFVSSRCIGAYCKGLKWYVNGKLQSGNPAGLILKDHQEIALVVGTPPAKIPKTYDWKSANV